ncbi:MAG: DinB family protein, partial [Pseudomonadota bacterium]
MDTRSVALFGLTATFTRINRCLEDISDDEARRLSSGLTPIIWQAGHIAASDFTFAARADGTSKVPAGYDALFSRGTGGEAQYPSLTEVKGTLARAQQALEAVARTADLNAPLDAPNYGNVGEMLTFVAYH